MLANFLSINNFAYGDPNLISLNYCNSYFILSGKSFATLLIIPLSILIYPIFFAFPKPKSNNFFLGSSAYFSFFSPYSYFYFGACSIPNYFYKSTIYIPPSGTF